MHRWYVRAAVVLLVGLLAAGARAWEQNSVLAATPTLGDSPANLSEHGVLSRAAHLFALLPNSTMGQRMVTDGYYAPAAHGGLRPYWRVDSLDAAGDSAAELILDGETGGVLYACCSPPRPGQHRGNVQLRLSEAVAVSRQAMRDLGIIDEAPSWRLKQPPFVRADKWAVYWGAADRYAIVDVDARTGQILSAQIVFHPGHGRRSAYAWL